MCILLRLLIPILYPINFRLSKVIAGQFPPTDHLPHILSLEHRNQEATKQCSYIMLS
jgi:hypothetical protein